MVTIFIKSFRSFVTVVIRTHGSGKVQVIFLSSRDRFLPLSFYFILSSGVRCRPLGLVLTTVTPGRPLGMTRVRPAVPVVDVSDVDQLDRWNYYPAEITNDLTKGFDFKRDHRYKNRGDNRNSKRCRKNLFQTLRVKKGKIRRQWCVLGTTTPPYHSPIPSTRYQDTTPDPEIIRTRRPDSRTVHEDSKKEGSLCPSDLL